MNKVIAYRWRTTLLCCCVLLSACAEKHMVLPQSMPEPTRTVMTNAASAPKAQAASAQSRIETLQPLRAYQKPVEASRNLHLPKGKLELNADALPLNRFVHMALGDVLHLAFNVDSEVAKRTDPVTLHVSKPVDAERLLGMVEEVLRLYHVALVNDSQGVSVLPEAKLAAIAPDPNQERRSTLIRLGRVMEFVPLFYAEPVEALAFAHHFIRMGVTGDVQINARLHAILVIGDAKAVSQFREAIALVDRPSLQGRYLRIIRPVYWQAGKLKESLRLALSAQGVRVANEKGSHSDGMRLIVVKPINTLIVASPRKDWLNALLDWVQRLDIATAVGSGSKHFVYFVKNARAKELGQVIAQVLSGRSVATTGPLQSKRNTGSVPVRATAAGTKADAPAAIRQAGKMAVITDERRNALIFVGSADAYRDVLPLLGELDKQPRQVLIEATVAEVTLDNTTQFGIEAGFSNVDHSSKLNGILSTVGGLGVGAGGLTYSLLNLAGSVRLKLNALAIEGRVKVLSSPRLLAMDNEKARIQIGDQIAVLSQQVTNASATTGTSTGLLASFNYVDTGVILEVTPTINEGGVVQLKLHQEVSTPGASANNTPPIAKRSVDTTMVAKSGQTVLIGGMISHTKSTSRTKIPLLGDIPLLGHLFSNDSIADKATELIVLITPHIISGPDDAAYLTRAFRQQLGWEDAAGRREPVRQ